MQTRFLLESVKQRYLLEGQGADGRIIEERETNLMSLALLFHYLLWYPDAG
jgi:hypothetical protein